MKRAAIIAAFAAAVLAASPVRAVQPDEIMADPAKEARARELSKELRCMVCQNQSIDDSDAPLARDLRLLVRERISAGDTNSQVIDFLVARYGEFVLLKPRLNPHTALLWLLPPLALMGGGIALWVYSNRRRRAGGTEALMKLTADEEARLEKLLASDPSPRDDEPSWYSAQSVARWVVIGQTWPLQPSSARRPSTAVTKSPVYCSIIESSRLPPVWPPSRPFSSIGRRASSSARASRSLRASASAHLRTSPGGSTPSSSRS